MIKEGSYGKDSSGLSLRNEKFGEVAQITWDLLEKKRGGKKKSGRHGNPVRRGLIKKKGGEKRVRRGSKMVKRGVCVLRT